MPRNTAASGCTTARSSIHGSRGRTQQIRSGAVPRPSSHTTVSVAVFPDPTTTYRRGSSSSPGRAEAGRTRAPGSTANGGGVVAGIRGERYRASTIRQLAGTS